MREEVLRLDRVVCAEQGVTQLDNFNLAIFSGEIMGLLPLNNHGLTTLIRLLQVGAPLEGGYVYYREELAGSWRKSRIRPSRIGVIQGESSLVDGLTVADNIFVLRPGFRTRIMRPGVLRQQLLPFLADIGIQLSADTYVEELTDFQRVVVELLKAVVAGCRLIVLRDIGTHLPELELRQIYQILRHYTGEGISFLYVDFHFEELQQVCDRIAMMGNGRIVKVLHGPELNSGSFMSYTEEFSGRVRRQLAKSAKNTDDREPVFAVRGLSGDGFADLSFSVASGQCLVLQDVDNLIYGELLDLLTGRRPPDSGEIILDGTPFIPRRGRELAVVQELPTQTMLFRELSYLDNLCITVDHRLPELWHSGSVRRGVRRAWAGQLGDKVFDRRIDSLTEIEKYELVYYRVALQKPKVAFCVQPFRRADMELRIRIWELLNMLRERGIAVVILAVNLSDSLSLADRLIRISRDRPAEQYDREDFANMSIAAPWLNFYREPG